MSLARDTRVMVFLTALPSEGCAWSRVVKDLSTAPEIDQLILVVPASPSAPDPRVTPLGPSRLTLSFETLVSMRKNLDVIGSSDAFRLAPGYQNFRFVALKLLNRFDFSGTFRFLEREVLLAGAVSGVLQVFADKKPNLIVFDVTPHEFFQYVVWSIAVWLGIPVLFFQPSPIAPAMLARTSLDRYVNPPSAQVANSAVREALVDGLVARLRTLVEGLDPTYMRHQKQRDQTVLSARHRWAALRATFEWLFSDRFPNAIDLSGHERQSGPFTRGLKILLGRSLQLTLRARVNALGNSESLPSSYCVFALHYEPERTSLPEGLPVDFQGDALVAARTLMPPECALVVKEHYSQQTSALRGFLGRSPLFYDFIESLPNTRFARTSDRLSGLVEEAQCVFTLTGTVAIEAVLRGVPVAYFGTPWWSGLPGTVRLTPQVSFDDILQLTMPSESDVFAFFANLTLTQMIPGIASESVQVVERRLGALPERFIEAEATSIRECVFHLLDLKRTSASAVS
jgi:hypothetical protein